MARGGVQLEAGQRGECSGKVTPDGHRQLCSLYTEYNRSQRPWRPTLGATKCLDPSGFLAPDISQTQTLVHVEGSCKHVQIWVSYDRRADVGFAQVNELFPRTDGKRGAGGLHDGGTTDGDEDPPTSDIDDSALSAISSAVSADEDDNIEPAHRKRKRIPSIDPSNERDVSRKFPGTHAKCSERELSDDIKGNLVTNLVKVWRDFLDKNHYNM